MIRTSATIEKLAPALALAQSEMTAAGKDAKNPHFNSKYADLASIWNAFREPFAKHSLAILQAPGIDQNHVKLTTRVMHCSGEWIESDIEATAKDSSPQSIGSCVTYLRRYGAAALIGIVSDDDDGNAAQSPGPQREAARRPAPAPAPRPTTDRFAKPPGTDRHTNSAAPAAAPAAAKSASGSAVAPAGNNAAPAAGMDPKAECNAMFPRLKAEIGDRWAQAVWKHTYNAAPTASAEQVRAAWQHRLSTMNDIRNAVAEIRVVVGDAHADAQVDTAFGNVDLDPEAVQSIRAYLVRASRGEVANAEHQQQHAAVGAGTAKDEEPPF